VKRKEEEEKEGGGEGRGECTLPSLVTAANTVDE
jgi:hypothetical protein